MHAFSEVGISGQKSSRTKASAGEYLCTYPTKSSQNSCEWNHASTKAVVPHPCKYLRRSWSSVRTTCIRLETSCTGSKSTGLPPLRHCLSQRSALRQEAGANGEATLQNGLLCHCQNGRCSLGFHKALRNLGKTVLHHGSGRPKAKLASDYTFAQPQCIQPQLH